uniref:DNA topoisomerase II beta n=1 Tax=Cavia porcellus TaxID=10141 RepID=A0A286XM71_CAVPO
RFILEKIQGKITIENRSKKDLIQMLVQRGYESDPVKAWKEAQEKAAEEEETQNQHDDSSSDSGTPSGPDFNYILNMSLWSLTKEKVEELIKQRDAKGREVNDLKRKSPSDLWKEDLAAFVEELDGDLDTTVVKVEFDEEFSGTPVEGTGEEALAPSAPISKGPKPKREKKEPGTRVRKTPTASGKPSAKKVKKRNPWSDDESKSESDLEETEPVVIPRDSLLRRAAAERPKYTFDFSEEDDDDADDDDDNNDLEELKVKASPITNDGEDEFIPSDGLDKDEYTFSASKSKTTPEKSSHEKKSQDFGNLFSFPSYSQKSEDDSAKFDSNEEDTASVFSPSFGLKQTDKV